MKIRTFSDEAIQEKCAIIADSVVQVYKHIHNKYGNGYTFLAAPLKEDRSNIFGIIVLGDYIHYPLEDIYSLAANKLKINIPSAEYDWLRGHIYRAC